MNEHGGFAAARPGQQEQRSLCGQRRLALLRVQGLKVQGDGSQSKIIWLTFGELSCRIESHNPPPRAVLHGRLSLSKKSWQVDNYLGLPQMEGAQMLAQFRDHAKALGAEWLTGRVLNVL